MTEVASLILSVVATWKTCVQVFDIVDSGKKYGMDFEQLRIKLEVERIRLLLWGEAVGLNGAGNNQQDLDALSRSLLGCIQYMFEHSERLRNNYGLREAANFTYETSGDDGTPASSQSMLGPIFKRAYEALRKSAKDRQRRTSIKMKARWSIYDKKKFQNMIFEIKGCNDNLHSLFPNARKKASESLMIEINESNDLDALHSLQEATANGHEEISETASVRLDELEVAMSQNLEPVQNQGTGPADADGGMGSPVPALPTLEDQLKAIDDHIKTKHDGALAIQRLGPHSHSSRITMHVHWIGESWDRRRRPFNMDGGSNGLISTMHASLGLYHIPKFIKSAQRNDHDVPTAQDYILLDVESDARYESQRPGTTTIKGFGLESWDYELQYGKKQSETIFVNYAKVPYIQARQLLRRMNELQQDEHNYGWDLEREKADLEEFFTGLRSSYIIKDRMPDLTLIGDFYKTLNRTDIFTNFTRTSSIQYSIAMASIRRPKELSLRLGHHPDGATSGFTHQILASLVVQRLWLSNVKIVLAEAKLVSQDLKEPDTIERRNEALTKGGFSGAAQFYTKAIDIDSKCAVYHAIIASLLDPTYAKAWSRLGMAELKLGNAKRAEKAFQRAIQLAKGIPTIHMSKGLSEARKKLEAEIKATNSEPDIKVQDELRRAHLDKDWDPLGKEVQIHTLVHERQVEGLLLFAHRMKWPYINDTRDYAENVYNDMRTGSKTSAHLHDWLYGLMLPGKWMAFKLMTALVECTPILWGRLAPAYFYNSGLSLQDRSYWRVRTVLGRVLGCLPNVISLCGWIGPCPAIEFIGRYAEDFRTKPHHINVTARSVALVPPAAESDANVFWFGSSQDQYEAMRMRPDEEMPAYLEEVTDANKWAIPQPPVQLFSICVLKAIRLKELPLDPALEEKRADGGMDEEDVYANTQYRASLIIQIDNEDTITYTLYTNPVFVTLPACSSGPHEVHERALSRYRKEAWPVERLKEHTPDDDNDDDVMIINATGKGAELVARAWCSERGKNAVIGHADGPCFVCALRAAGKNGLDVKILIWV
ncbi:MAG: hypothetical protein Q9213_004556 [Squamulea squamosa]